MNLDHYKAESSWSYPWGVTTVTPPTADQIEQAQIDFDIKFPQEYIDLVRLHGGKSPEPGDIDIKRPNGHEDGTEVAGLLYIDRTNTDSRDGSNMYVLVDDIRNGEISYWMERDPNRHRLIPFAGDTYFGYFCFDYRQQPQRPTIAWLDLTRYPPDDGLENSVVAVATDLADLFSQLTTAE